MTVQVIPVRTTGLLQTEWTDLTAAVHQALMAHNVKQVIIAKLIFRQVYGVLISFHVACSASSSSARKGKKHIFVVAGSHCIWLLCVNRFLARKGTSERSKNLGTLLLRGSVTGNYLQSRQQHSEQRSNDIVLIQERNGRMFYKKRLFKTKTQF